VGVLVAKKKKQGTKSAGTAESSGSDSLTVQRNYS